MKWARHLLLIAVIIISVMQAAAHPGGTDGSGGHKNHSTGEYHYHHGYSAHQHPNGICPYNFHDNTTPSSSSSNRGEQQSNKPKVENPVIPQESKTEKTEISKQPDAKNQEKRSFGEWIVVCVLCLFVFFIFGIPFILVLLYCVGLVLYGVYCILDALHLLDGIKKKYFHKKRNKLIAQFGGKSCREFAGVPDGVVFDKDLQPVSIKGNSLIVFVRGEKSKYHTETCRHSCGASPRNVYSVFHKHEPCSICKPIRVTGVPMWVGKYKEAMKTKQKYGISDPDILYLKE